MQVEQNKNADCDPDVDEEVGATADADDFREPGCVRGSPHKVEPSGSGDGARKAYHGRPAILGAGVKQRSQQQKSEDALSDHRRSLRANRSTRIINASLNLWPFASE
jgi:hypothetical protein